MLFSIQSFVTDENDSIVTRTNANGEVVGTVVRLGELDANGLPIINHNGNVSSIIFTAWQSPKQLKIGQSVRGELFNLPFEKADGEVVNRNVIVAEGIQYDFDKEKFYTLKGDVINYIDEKDGNKVNSLIKSYVKLKEYYAGLSEVEAPAPVKTKTTAKAK